MNNLQKISIVGAGKVGRTLARVLRHAGYQIGAVVSRKLENAKAATAFIGAGTPETDVLKALDTSFVHFITVTDPTIPSIVKEFDSKGPASLAGHYFYHTSGAISSTALAPLQKKGAEIGSIHPLQVFAHPDKAIETLPGIYYAIEGTDKAMELAVQVVDRLQGKLLLIPTGRKVLYHVAGVFAANYLTVLVELAMSIMEEIGESPEDAYQALLPLMVGALENIEEFGTDAALTGPISRGDIETIQTHIDALKQLRPEILHAYSVLGQEATEMSVRGGKISAEKAKQLIKMLAEAEKEQ
jgi:predicted short-subunit dehydrogenase-like oxidoreductase (DUF2520 family)